MIVVADEDTASYVASAALVAVTEHVPCEVYDSVDPVTEQPAVPADVTAYVTAPDPEPPLVASATVEPIVPDVVVTVSAP